MLPFRDVVVTGLGCICAAGNSLEEVLASLDAAPPLPTLPEGFGHTPQHPVFSVPSTDTGPTAQGRTLSLAHEAARQALADAELTPTEPQAVVVGTSVGASPDLLPAYQDWKDGLRPDSKATADYLRSFTAEGLAQECGITGQAYTVTNACTSGADAIGLAFELIRGGLADCVLAGGADALSEMTYWGFCSLQLCSPLPCRPFDKERSGLNLGEGAAFMVLESREHAAKRGKIPLGHILGYGSAADGHHPTAPHPEADGLGRAVAEALRPSGLSVADVAFISAHATATPTNDAVEGAFTARLPGKAKVYGVKGAIGHCLGAAGAVEAVLALAHLRRGRVCPTHGFRERDPAIGLTPTVGECAVSGKAALSFSLGFGGNNAALLLGLGPPPEAENSAFPTAPVIVARGWVGPAGLGTTGLHGHSGEKRTAQDILKSRIPIGELRRLDHFSRLVLCADRDVEEPSDGPEEPERTGIILVGRFGSLTPTVDFWDSLLEFGPDGASALSFAASVQNIPAAQVSIKNGRLGSCLTLCGPGMSLEGALRLAENRLALGSARHIRLIVAEEYVPFFAELFAAPELGISPLKEGAAAFSIQVEGTGVSIEHASARIADLLTPSYRPNSDRAFVLEAATPLDTAWHLAAGLSTHGER